MKYLLRIIVVLLIIPTCLIEGVIFFVFGLFLEIPLRIVYYYVRYGYKGLSEMEISPLADAMSNFNENILRIVKED